jgi:hypothetical protein
MVRRIVKTWGFAWLMFFAVIAWWASHVLPTSRYWFIAESMVIPDAPVGDDVLMIVNRTIKRQVFGEWTVTVRAQQENGWSIYCVARGESDYSPLAVLPDPLTLDWWTYGQCEPPPPGTYFVTTTWAFSPAWIPGPRRTPPLVSNSFRVLEVDG